jgi:hypothetical protein
LKNRQKEWIPREAISFDESVFPAGPSLPTEADGSPDPKVKVKRMRGIPPAIQDLIFIGRVPVKERAISMPNGETPPPGWMS